MSDNWWFFQAGTRNVKRHDNSEVLCCLKGIHTDKVFFVGEAIAARLNYLEKQLAKRAIDLSESSKIVQQQKKEIMQLVAEKNKQPEAIIQESTEHDVKEWEWDAETGAVRYSGNRSIGTAFYISNKINARRAVDELNTLENAYVIMHNRFVEASIKLYIAKKEKKEAPFKVVTEMLHRLVDQVAKEMQS